MNDKKEDKLFDKATAGCLSIGCLGAAAVFIMAVLVILKFFGSYLFG